MSFGFFSSGIICSKEIVRSPFSNFASLTTILVKSLYFFFSVSLNFEKFSFSTHAGHKEITDFIYACDPNDVVIYHSDPNSARPHLVKELEQNGITTHSPENGQSYIIE